VRAACVRRAQQALSHKGALNGERDRDSSDDDLEIVAMVQRIKRQSRLKKVTAIARHRGLIGSRNVVRTPIQENRSARETFLRGVCYSLGRGNIGDRFG
jgi:hypothetical protein